MYSSILKNVIYPLGDIVLGTKLTKYYKMLENTQWLSLDEITDMQNKKFKMLVEHAYNNVQYYKQLFRRVKFFFG